MYQKIVFFLYIFNEKVKFLDKIRMKRKSSFSKYMKKNEIFYFIIHFKLT